MICKICGKVCCDKLNSFGYHLSITHKIKYKDYYDKYLKNENEGICPICGNPTSWRGNHYLICCSHKCGTIYSKDSREQTMIEKYGGKTTLESPILFKEMKETCKEKYGNENPGKYGGEIFENAMVEKYGVKSYLETYTDEQKTLYGRLGHTKEAEEKYKQTMKHTYGSEHPMLDHETFKKMRRKYKYNNLSFDSKPEIAYYIWLKDNNIDFEYQPNIDFEYEFNGKILHYRPDFKVENDIVEIKGLHFFRNKNPNDIMLCPYKKKTDSIETIQERNRLYESKHQCMIKNNVKILTNFDEYIKYVKNKYGKAFLESLKRK